MAAKGRPAPGGLFINCYLTFCRHSIILFVAAESEVELLPQKMGRPPSKNPKTAELHIRVTPNEKARIMDYCRQTGKTCLDLIRAGMEADNKK